MHGIFIRDILASQRHDIFTLNISGAYPINDDDNLTFPYSSAAFNDHQVYALKYNPYADHQYYFDSYYASKPSNLSGFYDFFQIHFEFTPVASGIYTSKDFDLKIYKYQSTDPSTFNSSFLQYTYIDSNLTFNLTQMDHAGGRVKGTIRGLMVNYDYFEIGEYFMDLPVTVNASFDLTNTH